MKENTEVSTVQEIPNIDQIKFYYDAKNKIIQSKQSHDEITLQREQYFEIRTS